MKLGLSKGRPSFNILTMYKGKLAAIILSFFWLLITSCDNQSQNTTDKNINQIGSLDDEFKNEFTSKLIRYIGRKPEDASHVNKFHAYFDDHYQNQINQHELIAYHNSNNKEYFVFTRIAPSIHLKKVAIGGYVQFDSKGNLKNIEQVFRTWKQVPDTLSKRVELLFPKMVKGESLIPYYTANIGNTEYIEFPNEEVWYDNEEQRWVSKREDVLSEFIQAKIDRAKEKIKEYDNNQVEKLELNDSLK